MNYPRYESHKIVGAVKITALDKGADGSIVVHLADGFPARTFAHRDPQRSNFTHAEVGWYLVEYDGGHCSASPASVFEDGYTLLDDPEPAAGSVDEAAASKPKATRKGKGSKDPAVDGENTQS